MVTLGDYLGNTFSHFHLKRLLIKTRHIVYIIIHENQMCLVKFISCVEGIKRLNSFQ